VDDGDAVDTLVQLERMRARTLGERLLETPDPERRRERLQWLSTRARRLQEDAGDGRWVSEQLRATEQALLEDERRQRLRAPLSGATPADVFDPAALVAALAPGDRLVEYGVVGDELLACVVGPDGVRLRRPLAAWPAVQTAAAAARFQIDALRHGAQGLAHRMPQLEQRARQRLAALHALLLAPLADALAGAQRVLVVPCGGLSALPFGALEDARGQAFGQTCQLAMAPSARVALHGLRRQPRPPRRALALGESSRLAHAAREARQVAAMFDEGTALTGESASLAALQSRAAQADLLHLACHARFRRDNPRFSALQLADAPLGVDLVESLDLGPILVVVSACETGLAEGDEAVGLVRAFLAAGAARVLASLWAVDDAVTARFMAHFYQSLRAGGDCALALAQAQRAIAATHPHPHFWGAFALHGGF
jgi:CHAT domain